MSIESKKIGLYILLLILFVSNRSVLAQVIENTQRPQASSFELDLSSSFGGIFYEDQVGLQMASVSKPIEGVINTNTYELGPNDLITLDIKGTQPVLMRGILVNAQGDIVLPLIGTININGKTIIEAQELVKKRANDTFKNPTVSITLEKARPAIIQVRGDVPHPGKYIIPAQSRLDFAVYQSMTDGQKQPNPNTSYSVSNILNKEFSVRNIEILRTNGEKKTADLISYYRTGDSHKNPFVRDGDLITILPAKRNNSRLSISGGVKAPLEVEYLNTDTPYSLLNLAGGFSENADTTSLLLVRKEGNSITQQSLTPEAWSTITLKENDRLIALYDNYERTAASAWVSGEIKIPGNFPIVDGVTSVFDLIKLAGDLTDKALPHAGYLLRAGSVENEVPNKFNTNLMRRTSDQLLQGLEYLELENNISKDKVYIDLNDETQLKSVLLFDGDKIFIPRDEKTIFVFGQVNNPGYFPFTPDGRGILEYVKKAGGFSLSADTDRIFVIKAGSNAWYKPDDTSISSGDKIFVDRIPYDELNAKRSYEVQKQQLKNQRTQLIMTGITTVTGIITTLVAIGVISK